MTDNNAPDIPLGLRTQNAVDPMPFPKKSVIDRQHLAEQAAEEREREWQAMLDVSKVTDEMTEREVAVAVIATTAEFYQRGRRYPAPLKDEQNVERLRQEVFWVFGDMVNEALSDDRPIEFRRLSGTFLDGRNASWVEDGDCRMYMTGVIRTKKTSYEDYCKAMGR